VVMRERQRGRMVALSLLPCVARSAAPHECRGCGADRRRYPEIAAVTKTTDDPRHHRIRQR
jgi:hypothetical protein